VGALFVWSIIAFPKCKNLKDFAARQRQKETARESPGGYPVERADDCALRDEQCGSRLL
jgi:hypothetical protein